MVLGLPSVFPALKPGNGFYFFSEKSKQILRETKAWKPIKNNKQIE